MLKKGHVTFQGKGYVMSRSLILILVADIRMHLCAKFAAIRTIRLRVIQMAPERDGQSNRQTDRQTDRQSNNSGHHDTDKTSFSQTFCGKKTGDFSRYFPSCEISKIV